MRIFIRFFNDNLYSGVYFFNRRQADRTTFHIKCQTGPMTSYGGLMLKNQTSFLYLHDFGAKTASAAKQAKA